MKIFGQNLLEKEAKKKKKKKRANIHSFVQSRKKTENEEAVLDKKEKLKGKKNPNK